ncbi:MAG: hypothetical protein ACP5LN_06445 [Thermoproteota archaeon]|jgi:hypothetical protein
MKSSADEVKNNILHIKFKDNVKVKNETVLQFHPEIKPLIDEILAHGWSYNFEEVEGEAEAKVDLSKVSFEYTYYPPRIERDELEGKYELSLPLGSEPPAIIEIKKVDRFKIRISTKSYWWAATIDPFSNKVTYLENPFKYSFLSKEDKLKRLSQARELYELSKWLFQKKKMKAEYRHILEDYKDILDKFKAEKYKFSINLRVTVEDEGKVPSWEELLEDLSKFFKDRGLVVKLKEKPGFFFRKKPIP